MYTRVSLQCHAPNTHTNDNNDISIFFKHIHQYIRVHTHFAKNVQFTYNFATLQNAYNLYAHFAKHTIYMQLCKKRAQRGKKRVQLGKSTTFYKNAQLSVYNFTTLQFTYTLYKTHNLQTHTLQLCNFTYATLYNLHATLQMQLYNFIHTLYRSA